MKTTVIYHSADFDGIFCREIARRFLPDAELIGWDFADKPLVSHPDTFYYILDLPCDRPFGFMHPDTDVFWKRCIWIDHHKSSIETHPKDIPGYRIDGVAACRLAWQWFSGGEKRDEVLGNQSKTDFIDRIVTEPLAIRLAGEYDIWDKRDPDAETFQFGLKSTNLSPEKWQWMLGGDTGPDQAIPKRYNTIVLSLLGDGKLIQAYQRRNDGEIMARSFMAEFEGLKFLALTTARCNSLTFAAKDVPETGHDALMGFYFLNGKWNVSLYHAKHNTGIDLSAIAVKYGGGGHRGACGFQVEKLPFLN